MGWQARLSFAFLAISTASFLLRWTFVKFLGGGYLVYIAVKHLFFESKEEDHEKIEMDASGNPQLVDAVTGGELTSSQQALEIKERAAIDPDTVEAAAGGLQSRDAAAPKGKKYRATFWPTVVVIELTDVAFAVDSILAAIALVGSPPPGTPVGAFHPKLWVVIAGGLLGVILMRFAARVFITLLEKFPRFETAAYLLVVVIGLKLLADWGCNSDWTTWGWDSHTVTANYHSWLSGTWPLGVAGELDSHTHLIDFHDWRRPEFSIFWLLMVASFCVGFLPKTRHAKTF